MLLSIQFPFSDSRPFLGGTVPLLGRPTWPAVSPDYDFVRSFGSIRTRRLGGVIGWIGENAVCEADRALRFLRLRLTIPLAVCFRRFYYDGLALAKYEVGLASTGPLQLSVHQTRTMIDEFLILPVSIPALPEKAVVQEQHRHPIRTALIQAGKPLARLYSGSTISHPPPVVLKEWWVLSGSPLLFLVHGEDERLDLPYSGRVISARESLNVDLRFCEIRHEGRHLRMWVMGLRPGISYREARSLKISLLRLHAEREALRLIIQNIATGKIVVAPRSNESDFLQAYLREATKRIARLEARADYLCDADVSELARESEDAVYPGEREALLSTLRNLDIRRNIFEKVRNTFAGATFISHGGVINVAEEQKIGKYNVDIDRSTVGAIGDEAQVSGNTFTSWQQSGGNLAELAKQLATLQQQLKSSATNPEHYESIAAVARAESAAKGGDGAGVFAHLKTAGAWALDVAKSIAVPIATDALKRAIGMPPGI